jgi:hypothetical protein
VFAAASPKTTTGLHKISAAAPSMTATQLGEDPVTFTIDHGFVEQIEQWLSPDLMDISG